MKPSKVKVGDFAVNVREDCDFLTIGKKYQIGTLSKTQFSFFNDFGQISIRELDDPDFAFEPNPLRLNTQTIIIEVSTKVVVTFEKTEIERGEEYLIKTFELADLTQLRKEIAYQVENLANPVSDIVNVKWEK